MGKLSFKQIDTDKLSKGEQKDFLPALTVIVMVVIILLGFIVGIARSEVYDSEEIADAIYHIEGGAKAKKPFGILSIPCHSYRECRRICINTVQNNFTRWQLAGSQGDFLKFLADRYAPPSAHPLNKNWYPNLVKLLGVTK